MWHATKEKCLSRSMSSLLRVGRGRSWRQRVDGPTIFGLLPLLLLLITSAGCAQKEILVYGDSPTLPTLPQGVTERAKSASTAQPLTERYKAIDDEFQGSLTKAIRP